MNNPAADYMAFLTNCLIMGAERIEETDGSWYLGKISLNVDGRAVELLQHREFVVGAQWSELRNQWRHTTNLFIPGLTEAERDAATAFAERLAVLLGFITASEVAVAGWSHHVGGQHGLHRTTSGRINDLSPVIDTRDGKSVKRAIELMWDGVIRESDRRKLPAVFHYLALAERDETPIELKLAILFIVLEQLKHSFAVSNNYVFIPPWFHAPGTVNPTNGTKRGFKRLLAEMFASVGMAPALDTPVDVRNEILHSGLSGRDFLDLVALEGDITAMIREYILRLLGYSGAYYTGRTGGESATV
jgi:hypothetical protein